MDLYLPTSTEPGLTLQEMIEYDIQNGGFEDCFPDEVPSKITKMDFESSPFDLDSVDLTAMGDLDGEFEFKPFEPISMEAEILCNNKSSSTEVFKPSTKVESSNIATTIASDNNGSFFTSMSSYNLDNFEHGTLMVNPSIVLPSTVHGNTGTSNSNVYFAVSTPAQSPSLNSKDTQHQLQQQRNKVLQGSPSPATPVSSNEFFTVKNEPIENSPIRVSTDKHCVLYRVFSP